MKMIKMIKMKKQTSLGKAKGVPVMKKPAYMKPRASKTLQKKMGF